MTDPQPEPTPELDPRACGAKRFVDKNAIVTGAGQGIGRASARRLAQEGARVLVADRHQPGAARVEEELRQFGCEAASFVGDISSREGAQALIAKGLEVFGRIDVLVNCVGGSMHGPKLAWEYTPDEIEANVQNNLWSTLWCCWSVLPHMVAQQSGVIVNIGSNSPRGTMRFPYAAAKGAVFAMTTSLGLETAPLGVRVNCVAPHFTLTDDRLVTRLGDPSETGMPANVERTLQRHLPNIPMGRPATSEEQAAAVAFLASDDASFITGQILTVGGGASAVA